MTNIALVYDADYTLMDGYHPSTILKRRGIDVDEFWKMVVRTQTREKAKLMKDDVHYILPAKYTKDSALWSVVSSFIQSKAPITLR